MEKERLGSNPFVFPMPAAIVGANVDDRPNFMTIAYCGVVNSGPTMVAIGTNPSHHTRKGIEANGTFSVNIPDDELVGKTDYIGIYSGKDVDKSELFDVFYGKLGNAPLVGECPINLECKVVKSLELGGMDVIYIGEVVETYCRKDVMTNGLPDIGKIRPLIYAPGSRQYWTIGKKLADAWNVGKEI
ncbi:MAG TPA: flavin reductase family protein [Candidatus Methanofastidiosa archaeon]|nr:flavin reductase family protein [Candidatus Methanofastidiosa archaeon]HPR42160.1 flavin reductase family protein [Candidatus Methanofastidiosa archaeon]